MRACVIYVRSILLVIMALQHNMLSVHALYLRLQHLICPKHYSGSQILQQNEGVDKVIVANIDLNPMSNLVKRITKR